MTVRWIALVGLLVIAPARLLAQAPEAQQPNASDHLDECYAWQHDSDEWGPPSPNDLPGGLPP